jgi:hypothetical protein
MYPIVKNAVRMFLIRRNRAVFFVWLLVAGRAFGQAEQIDSVLQLYRRDFLPEKVYLQFDKSVYKGGETIWFKAYLLSGGELSDISRNFYVDFYGPDGRLLKHFVTPVFQSSAKGQFDIPAGYAGAFIHVKAYTQWMLNFDPGFIYSKDVYVVGGSTNVDPPNGATLQFFPEGGDLIEGVNTKLAFLAADQAGRPLEVSGSIVTGGGSMVDSFSTQHDGMGSITFTPKPNETYMASWQGPDGRVYTTPLPGIKKDGVGIYVQPLPKRTMVLLTRTQGAGDDAKTLHLVAYKDHQLVYRSRFNLTAKLSGVAEIPTDKLSSGILQITVFNGRLVPLAERIAFVNNHNYGFVTDVAVQAKGVGPRGKNIIEISTPDTLPANLSISVTDADLGTDKGNIVSQLLLCDDVKGYIHNPSYYFDTNTDSVRQALDLVMLTHGWRRFDWAGALSGAASVLRYGKDSDYIQIRGKTYIPSGVKVAPDQKLFLILQAKDSSKQVLTIPVDKDGAFVLHGAIFFDTVRVFYAWPGDKKLERKSEMNFRSGFMPPQASGMWENYSSPWLWSLHDSVEVRREKYFAAKEAELEKKVKATTLEKVVVKGRLKSSLELLDERYTSGLFSGGDPARQFDLTNDQRANGMYNIFQYLQGLIAGLQIVQSQGAWNLTWRGETPALFLDEMRIDAVALDNVPLTDIAYVKVFRPPFFGAATGGTGGAIAVYRKKGAELMASAGSDPILNYKFLEGYSPFKQFYSPDYSVSPELKPDVRTTLYWRPYIIMDSGSRRARIEFYNNDISRRLRVVVEGVDAAGKLTRAEKVID